MRELNGIFVLNKTLSQSPDALLTLQGLSWLTRKAISLATITLTIRSHTESQPESNTNTQFTPANNDDSVNTSTNTTDSKNTASPTVTHIKISSTVSGLRTTTQENRTLDWTIRSHRDSIFGNVQGRSRFVQTDSSSLSSTTASFSLARDEDSQINHSRSSSSAPCDTSAARDHDIAFLTGHTLSDGSTPTSFAQPESVHSYARNVDAGYGWTAEQTWNIEVVAGQRYYTRRIVCWSADGKKVERIRLVYDYIRGLEGERGKGEEGDDGLAYGDDS